MLIDRGHRELPITANYCGKIVNTEKEDHIVVKVNEFDGEDAVVLEERRAAHVEDLAGARSEQNVLGLHAVMLGDLVDDAAHLLGTTTNSIKTNMRAKARREAKGDKTR